VNASGVPQAAGGDFRVMQNNGSWTAAATVTSYQTGG